MHTEILPTPDSAPGSQDLYGDNVTYMDKLIGKLIAELERQHLREKTLIVFFGDNGTAEQRSNHATIGGRRLNGAKGSMLEGGSLEPLIVNWPGVSPAGRICDDLIDSTDFLPTFAAVASAKLPVNTALDGHNFLPQIQGEKGQPREWVFLQLANQWYTRNRDWKLTQSGQLYNMSDAPFSEKLVPTNTTDTAALAARQSLQSGLAQLNPAGGFVDKGDGTGRHANKAAKAKKQKL